MVLVPQQTFKGPRGHSSVVSPCVTQRGASHARDASHGCTHQLTRMELAWRPKGNRNLKSTPKHSLPFYCLLRRIDRLSLTSCTMPQILAHHFMSDDPIFRVLVPFCSRLMTLTTLRWDFLAITRPRHGRKLALVR